MIGTNMIPTHPFLLWIGMGITPLGVFLGALLPAFLLSGMAGAQEVFNPNARNAGEAIGFAVMANRILAHEGIFDAYGHVSVRNPENPKTFFIARAVAPELVTKADIIEVDIDGNVVTKTTMQPYQERIIHASIYRMRPDVNSIIHAHPAPIIAFSVSTVPLKAVMNGASMFHKGVPVYDDYDFESPGNTGMLVTTKDQGEGLAKCLGSGAAVLMRGHGYTVVGSSVSGAVNNAITLRDNAVTALMALQLGTPKYISDKEAGGSGKGGSPERAWDAWVHRVKSTRSDTR